jgi:hypothetical protein
MRSERFDTVDSVDGASIRMRKREAALVYVPPRLMRARTSGTKPIAGRRGLDFPTVVAAVPNVEFHRPHNSTEPAGDRAPSVSAELNVGKRAVLAQGLGLPGAPHEHADRTRNQAKQENQNHCGHRIHFLASGTPNYF